MLCHHCLVVETMAAAPDWPARLMRRGTEQVVRGTSHRSSVLRECVGDNLDLIATKYDPTPKRKTFAGFATRISGQAARCETRGRFLIETNKDDEASDSCRALLKCRGSLPRMDSLATPDESPAAPRALVEFITHDRLKRRKRKKLLSLAKHESHHDMETTVACWAHIGEPPKRSWPKIEPLSMRGAQARTPEGSSSAFSGVPSDPGITRRAITTLLGGAFRRKTLDAPCTPCELLH